MNRIVKLFCSGEAVMALGTGVFAQDAGPKGKGGQGQGQFRQGPGGQGKKGPGMRVGRMQQEVLAKLNLTAAQKAKIEALNKKMQAEVQKLMQGGDREQMREKFRPLMEQHRKDLMAILTKEQQVKYEQLVKEAREKMRQGRGGPGGQGPAGGAGKGKGKGGGSTGGGGQ